MFRRPHLWLSNLLLLFKMELKSPFFLRFRCGPFVHGSFFMKSITKFSKTGVFYCEITKLRFFSSPVIGGYGGDFVSSKWYSGATADLYMTFDSHFTKFTVHYGWTDQHLKTDIKRETSHSLAASHKTGESTREKLNTSRKEIIGSWYFLSKINLGSSCRLSCYLMLISWTLCFNIWTCLYRQNLISLCHMYVLLFV